MNEVSCTQGWRQTMAVSVEGPNKVLVPAPNCGTASCTYPFCRPGCPCLSGPKQKLGWAVVTQGQQHQGEQPLPAPVTIKTGGRFLFQHPKGRCFSLFWLTSAAIPNAIWKSVFLCTQLFSFTSLTMTKAWSWITSPAAPGYGWQQATLTKGRSLV